MMRMKFGLPPDRPPVILCLGAHSDDIEIGCGGAILRLCAENPACEIHWVVFSAEGIRASEARASAHAFAGHQLKSLVLKPFRDGFLPYVGIQVKELFEEELKAIQPDLIFTHQRNDLHQDHRLISELSLNTFRNHLIFEYEIPKYDGDFGTPGVYMPLEREMCDTKVRYILEAFASQRAKRWFEESTFMAVMRLRGMECNSPSGYAEAFYGRKVSL
jgi:LmbE family N-acetylglucosaminyl deacetylase